MRRWSKFLVVPAALAAALSISACGTQKISVPKSNPQLYHGAVLFSERCAGCHTLYAAATHGSAPNIRTAQAISGPNFNVRCERPIDSRPVRDRQRRLLRRLHAAEHRRRPGCDRCRQVRGDLCGREGAQADRRRRLPRRKRSARSRQAPRRRSTTTPAAGGSSSSAAASVKAGMTVFDSTVRHLPHVGGGGFDRHGRAESRSAEAERRAGHPSGDQRRWRDAGVRVQPEQGADRVGGAVRVVGRR